MQKVYRILEKFWQLLGDLFVIMTFWSATWFGELLCFSLFLVYFTTICLIIFAVLKLEMSASVFCTTCVLWNNWSLFYLYVFVRK
jgi:hypothetical protein